MQEKPNTQGSSLPYNAQIRASGYARAAAIPWVGVPSEPESTTVPRAPPVGQFPEGRVGDLIHNVSGQHPTQLSMRSASRRLGDLENVFTEEGFQVEFYFHGMKEHF